AGLTCTARPGAPLETVIWAGLRPGLPAGECQPEDTAVHRKPLLGKPPGVVGQRVALADILDLWSDPGVPAAGHVWIQVVLNVVTEVAADDVEQWAAVDVGRTDQLADVPTAAGFVLHFFCTERVGLVGEMSAENDGVRPHVADDVGQRV